MSAPMIIAHRGGKALGPENTISTMKKALAAGAQGIELDVRATFHQELAVIHDATLERTTNGTGEVAKMNMQQIQRFDAGDGLRVPSLLQVLDELSVTNARVFIDLKHPSAALPTAKIVEHYVQNKGYMQSQIVIISFLHQALVMIREKYPKLILGASLKEIPEGLAACGEYTGAKFVLPSIDILNMDFARDAQKRGLKLVTFTCDTKEQIEKAMAHEVDGIITGDPGLLKPQGKPKSK